jgi:DNA-binding NarL/FixJ family response regulator
MRFAKHLKHVVVVVLRMGQNNDWHKLMRRETNCRRPSTSETKKKNIIRRATAVLIAQIKITDRDRRILSLREKGLWASEIAAVLDMKVSTVHDTFDRLRKIGLSIPPANGLRPNANRKVSDEQIIALARSRLTMQEIAAKVGISKKNVHARLKALRTES